MLQISVSQPGKKVRQITWHSRELSLGRNPDGNDLVSEDRFISASHGLIEERSRGWFYRDLGSSNGSLLQRGDPKCNAGASAHPGGRPKPPVEFLFRKEVGIVKETDEMVSIFE